MTVPPDPAIAAAKKRSTPLAKTLEASDIELVEFVLTTLGADPDIDIAESIIDGEILLDMTAPQISVTVHDQDRRLVKSQALWNSKGQLRALDVEHDGVQWRLMTIDKRGDDFTLVFEIVEQAQLREKEGPRKAASRAKVTRAQYILTLVRSITKSLPYNIPELAKKQPIAKPKKETSRQRSKRRDENKQPGFDYGVKTAGLTKGQLENVAISLGVAEEESAPKLAVLGMLCAGFGESQWKASAKDFDTGTHRGVYQANTQYAGPGGPIDQYDTEGQARHFLIGGRSFLGGGAIAMAKAHPDWTPGRIATEVEGSGENPTFYDRHRGKARKLLTAWNGEGSFSDSVTAFKRYEYKVEKDETYWDAIVRMANQVKWRAFFSVMAGKVTFYYASDKQLMEARATYSVSEDTDGVSTIDFQESYRKRVQTATITARLDKWKAPPGTVLIIEDINDVGSRRYLVESIRRSLFSPEAEISVTRPIESRKEPAPDSYSRNATGDDTGTNVKRGHVQGYTSNLTPELLRFVQEIAGATDETIVVWNGKKHNKYTTEGNISGHWSGNAADIDVGGDARSSDLAGRKGDNIAVAALYVCGFSRADARKLLGGPRTSFQVDSLWRGHSIEIGWRTLVGGNHFTHVHVGFDKSGGVPAPGTSSDPAHPSPHWVEPQKAKKDLG